VLDSFEDGLVRALLGDLHIDPVGRTYLKLAGSRSPKMKDFAKGKREFEIAIYIKVWHN
jgi:hypothetical protein